MLFSISYEADRERNKCIMKVLGWVSEFSQGQVCRSYLNKECVKCPCKMGVIAVCSDLKSRR